MEHDIFGINAWLQFAVDDDATNFWLAHRQRLRAQYLSDLTGSNTHRDTLPKAPCVLV